MLGDDLTYKQFIFCEAYLRHFNADEAFREAYPNCKHRNSTNIMKSRKLQKYLRKRLQEKKATQVRLTDKMRDVLIESLDSIDPAIRLEATKQVARLEELEAKLKQLEVADEQAKQSKETTINFKVVTDGDDS